MYTLADLDRIDRAIASGHLSVQIGERRITYRSHDELQAARRHIDNELNKGKRGAVRQFHFKSLRGD